MLKHGKLFTKNAKKKRNRILFYLKSLSMSNCLPILNFLNSEKCLPIVLPTVLLILFFLAPWSNIRSTKGEQDAKKD